MHWHQSKFSPSRLRRRPLHSAVAALLAPFVTVMTVLEPNPKRVERFQWVVIQFGCEAEPRSRCPGVKPLAASMSVAAGVTQAT